MPTIASTEQAALDYAARGWAVFPLHSVGVAGCTCGVALCGSPGKHPHTAAGFKDATTDPAQIGIDWATWPDANVGIATGAVSGIVVLDVDPDHGGDLALADLIQDHGALPATVAAATGGGGTHYIFAHPGLPVRNRTNMRPGLDVRGDGGYIVAAPSNHKSGQCYAWIIAPDACPLAPLPGWLLALMLAPPKPVSQGVPSAFSSGAGNLPPRTLQYLYYGASNGTRNHELYAAAQQFYWSGLPLHEAMTQCGNRASLDGLSDADIQRTVNSAYNSAPRGPAGRPGGGGSSNGTPPSPPPPPVSPAPAAGQPAPPPSHKKSAAIVAALAQLGYTFRLNSCRDEIEVSGTPLTDLLAAQIRNDCRDEGINGGKGTGAGGAIEDAYMAAAIGAAYHPVKDYLTGLVWDGQPHIAALAATFQGADPMVVYASGAQVPLFGVYLWRWLIGAVAKALDGHQNMMLVLAGPQGTGKSHFARWLCSALPRYFLEAAINTDDKDSAVRAFGYFVWEVAELDATTRRADIAALNHFVTQREVTVRRSYGRRDTVKPALASLIGTINVRSGFLSDETGSRRFYIATVDRIDWRYTDLDIGQIWAEAVARYRAGEPWQLTAEEAAMQAAVNETHEAESTLDAYIERWFEIGPSAANTTMAAGDIAHHLRVMGQPLTGSEHAQAIMIAKTLKRLGVQKDPDRSTRRYRGIAAR